MHTAELVDYLDTYLHVPEIVDITMRAITASTWFIPIIMQLKRWA
jgi:hypothetical protein